MRLLAASKHIIIAFKVNSEMLGGVAAKFHGSAYKQHPCFWTMALFCT